MRDPFPIPPIPALSKAIQPYADRLGLQTLPLHIHEVVGFALFYTFIQVVVSPALSKRVFPRYYPAHDRAKKANWDSHVVSLVQSTLVNAVALWVIWNDDERRPMDWQQRVWGYTGACGLIQSMAAGYFIWDLLMTALHIDVFGFGLLAHAVSALTVYSFGFMPFLYYYGPVFILYELSTPFLNIHWFFDKLNMTGTKPQLYNGIILLVTFACCRLVYGTYQSACVYVDMYRATQSSPDAGYLAAAHGVNSTLTDPNQNMMAFATDAEPIPYWLALIYVASNITLNSLNWHWFFKMIAAVRKRFEPAKAPAAIKEKGDVRPTDLSETLPAYKAATTSAREKSLLETRKRRSTLEDLTPDSEELREGTIQ
ncbi:TLC domain-containing protein [Coniochaeta sp. 2T2.1]|nr:TLC domain-containing protein [Coniochaeta sp. 2T2.1]